MDVAIMCQYIRSLGGICKTDGHQIWGSVPVIAEVRGVVERMDIPLYVLVSEGRLYRTDAINRELEGWRKMGFAAGIVRSEHDMYQLIKETVNTRLTLRFGKVFGNGYMYVVTRV